MTESLLAEILRALAAAGPGIVFVVALAETAVFAGLVVPVSATIFAAAFMADRGLFPIWHVLAAAFAGGLAGDHIGYLLGRFGGRRIVAGSGRIARLWRRYEAPTARLFDRHAAWAVTMARFVAFIRTLSPWFAGMSGLSYPRYAVCNLLGVAGWAGLTVALGVLAGAGWASLGGALGTVAALVLVAGLAGVAIRRRRRMAAPAAAGSGADPAPQPSLAASDAAASVRPGRG